MKTGVRNKEVNRFIVKGKAWTASDFTSEMEINMRSEKNNHGFSIIELIIIMAIMAVLVSGLSIGVSIVKSNDIKKTNNYVNSILGNTKTYCLAKKSAECVFYKSGDDVKCKLTVNGEVISDEVIGGSKITIKYKVASTKGSYSVNDPSGVYEIEEAGVNPELKISFDHSSGALKPYEVVGGTKNYIYELYICKGSKVITYEFVPATGKFQIK